MQNKAKYFPTKNLNIFFLIMINIALFGGIKSWSLVGGYGLLSIVFFVLAVILFLLPGALVAMELGSAYPNPGGIYLWVREAFGHRLGFLVVWIYWFEVMLWLPAPLIKTVYLFAFAFHPILSSNIFFQLVFTLLVLWVGTFFVLYGFKILRWFTFITVILGIILPGLIIIALAFIHLISGKAVEQSFSLDVLWDGIKALKNWFIFAGIAFLITGIEATSMHMPNIKNPKKSYPRAVLFSFIFLISFYIIGSLSMTIIFPKEITVIFAGSLEGIASFIESLQLRGLFFFMMFMMSIGLFVEVINWLIIPVRGLLEVAKFGDLPCVFHHTNPYGMPSTLIILQSIILSVISILFILFPKVNITYWIALDIANILYLFVYMFIFAAALRLRYKKPQLIRPFTIPKGKLGIWIVTGAGFLISLMLFFFSFLVPEQTLHFSRMDYFPWFVLGLIFIFLCPSAILLFKKPSWRSHLVEEDTMPMENKDQSDQK